MTALQPLSSRSIRMVSTGALSPSEFFYADLHNVSENELQGCR